MLRCRQAYHHCVIRKFDDDVGAVCGYTVMRVQGVQKWAENTALRGSSVEGQRGGDVAAYSDHLPVRKSRNQLHKELFRPRARSFTTSLKDTMVLHAEL